MGFDFELDFFPETQTRSIFFDCLLILRSINLLSPDKSDFVTHVVHFEGPRPAGILLLRVLPGAFLPPEAARKWSVNSRKHNF